MADFFVVSLKHTRHGDPYVTFWRPDDKGYAWPLSWAGKYAEERIRADVLGYDDGFDAIVVPCGDVAPLLSEPASGTVDGDAGPVIANNGRNRQALLDAAIRASALREAAEPPVRRRDYDGHGDCLMRIAGMLLEDGLDHKIRMELRRARRAILEVGFYGCRHAGEDSDVLASALQSLDKAERRLAAMAVGPGLR